MQLTISQQLQLDPTTVANFFMNARRRGHDRCRQDDEQQQTTIATSAANTDPTLTSVSAPTVFEQL